MEIAGVLAAYAQDLVRSGFSRPDLNDVLVDRDAVGGLAGMSSVSALSADPQPIVPGLKTGESPARLASPRLPPGFSPRKNGGRNLDYIFVFGRGERWRGFEQGDPNSRAT